MARIVSNWHKFRAPVKAAEGWREMKEWLGDVQDELPEKSVYLVRTVRPFSIIYKEKASPVMYIGEGDFRKRLRDHMEKWISGLSGHLPTLKIEVIYQSILVRGNSSAYKEVEADMIWKFGEIYGSAPLFNQQFEYHERTHIYDSKFFNVLHPGAGRGFHWGLTPLASNLHYQKYLKGHL